MDSAPVNVQASVKRFISAGGAVEIVKVLVRW
jgi:hypothetical protein